MSNFKEIYLDELSNAKQDAENPLEVVGISEERFNAISDKFQEMVSNIQEEGVSNDKPLKRSDFWLRAMYELEPQTVMETFFIGNMIGDFENRNTNVGKDDNPKDMLKRGLISASVVTFRMEIKKVKDSPEKIMSTVEQFEEFLLTALQEL